MNDSNCEGCASRYYTYKGVTNIRHESIHRIVCGPLPKDESCPCSICLVKMICHDMCEKFNNYRGNTIMGR